MTSDLSRSPQSGTTDATHAGRRDPQGFLDLSDYVSIGDGRTVALIGTDGRIDWLPLPDLDSTPVFAALLDPEDGGWIGLEPSVPYTVERHYLEQTNALVTTYTTQEGSARVTDVLTTGVAGRLPWSELARRIDGLTGTVPFRATLRPGSRLRTAAPWVSDTVHGAVVRVDGLTLAVRALRPDEPPSPGSADTADPLVSATYTARPGSRHLFAVVATEDEPLQLPAPADIDARIDPTVDSWRRWTAGIQWDGPWRSTLERSALVLKQLIYAPTGAVAAAATTSLPESASGGKNWDYRYAWIRDAAFTLTALFTFGVREEVQAAMSWLLRVMRGMDLPSVFYRLDGTVPPTGTTRYDVPGWRGNQPVVSGNGAAGQAQLGVYGDLFRIVTLYVDHGNVLDVATGRQLAGIADHVCDVWRREDAGIWELHQDRHYTVSKVGCWTALTQAAHLSEIGQIPGDSSRWRAEAQRIRRWVDAHGWSEERGSYVWYAGTDQLDASTLLLAVSGFDRGDRMRRTIDALVGELGDGDHLYRYSGAADEESTFVACSFWLVSALALTGQTDRARGRFERLLAVLPASGVLTEMYDPSTGRWWGNLPQALSHLALLNAAAALRPQDRSPTG